MLIPWILSVVTPDLINGILEASGSIFVLKHCWALWKSKQSRGVSLLSTIFFAVWGFWNIYYYPHLDQILSLYGGMAIVAANCIWIGLIIYLRLKEKNGKTS